MDPVTRAALGLLLGLVLAPSAPGSSLAWTCVAVGAALIALPWRGLIGARGALAALLLGIAVARSLPAGPTLEGQVSVIGVRVGAALGRSADLEVQRWAHPGSPWRAARGRIRVRFPDRPPSAGTSVVLQGRAGPVRPALPGAPDPVRAAALASITTELIASEVAWIAAAPRPGPAHDPTGVLAAVALGDRSGVPFETMQLLRHTGTAHLLAISGFHVGVVAALAAGLATAWLRALAILRPSGLPVGAAALLGVLTAWAYALAAGAPLSAQRAAGLLGLAALGRAMGRQTRPLPLLAVVGAVIGVVDPSAPATPGFQLSFGAILGLVLIGPRLAERLPERLPWLLDWASKGMIATIASTGGTLPAAAWWFQQLAPLSPLANLGALPLMGLGIVPAAAAACWAPAPLDHLAGVVGTILVRCMLWGLQPLAIAPLAPAVGPLGAIVLAVGLLLALRRPWLGALVIGVTLAVRPPAARELRLTFLDVGQGDAVLIEHPGGQRWLVDGGPSRRGIVGWLRRRGIRHLDVVVATHGEWDHYAGLLPVVEELRVGQIWAHDPPQRLLEAANTAQVPIVAPPQALWPPLGSLADWRGNDRSIVLGIGGALLTGDVEATAEEALAAQLPHRFPILKVPHHGSATSSSPALLQAVQPELAIVSAGRDNPFGHPHPEVLQRLAEAGAELLRTDRDGTITVQLDADGRWRYTTATGRSGASP